MTLRLSAKQSACLDQTCDEWLQIIRSCGPVDRREAEQAVLQAYDRCAFDPPKVVWCESPLSFALTRALYDRIRFERSTRKRNAFLRRIPALLRRLLPAKLALSIGASLDATLAGGCPVGTKRMSTRVQWQLCQLAGSHIRGRIPKNLWREALKAIQARGLVSDHYNYQVYSATSNAVSQLAGALDLRGLHYDHEHLRHDELARSAYFRRLGLLDETSPLWPLERLAQWMQGLWTHADICWLLPRPTSVGLDERGNLHDVSGPALLYPDGWSVHAIRGVQVPGHVVELPETITLSEIDAERNVEVRRVMIERYGQARYLADAGASIIAKDKYGTLWRKELPDDEPLVMVQLKNSTPEPDGTCKEYFLRVPPDMRTPTQAVAWSFWISEKEYRPVIET